MRYKFIPNAKYKRKDVYQIIGIPENTKGGHWDTGYAKFQDDWFIFCNIGIPGRTGHDYKNEFIGDELVWYGKNRSKIEHPTIQSLLNPKGMIYVFVRYSQVDPFTYVGAAKAKSVEPKTPVKITWKFDDSDDIRPEILPEEVIRPEDFYEGTTKTISINIFERNLEARSKCIKYHDSKCLICGFDFEQMYGDIGMGYIHVHHLKPLAEIGEEYEVDPVTDMVPVCPNCHSMIHRRKPPYTVGEIKQILSK